MHKNKTTQGGNKNFGHKPAQDNTQEQNQTRGRGEKKFQHEEVFFLLVFI